ncbi:hypothetical protein V5799_016155 [Amblyomma americanum]|uniref:ELYS-like domain-containing protein n=1 Tax=Amblyomma americanum TaxID=6943 RepID=A0AAQ4F5V2_AMBAM
MEELRIFHRLLGKARGMQMVNPWLVAVWHDVVGLPLRHLSPLLFLLQSGLQPDHRVREGSLVYPCTTFKTWCQQAKSDKGRKMLVDIVLVEAALGDAADPGRPLQDSSPCPSIYLIPGHQPSTPLVIYFQRHISAIIVNDCEPLKETLHCFLSPIDLSTDVPSLVQDIWHLDRGNHEEGVECQLQAQQQLSAALRLLLGALLASAVCLLHQCQPPLGVRCLAYLQVASALEKMTLNLDVLLATCRVIDALQMVRKHGYLPGLEQLLGCVMALARKLKVWEAHAKLELLLQVPLSVAEEDQLVSCFCDLVDPTWTYHVVQDFLQCGRPHAALSLTGCIQEQFRERRTQQSYLPEVRRKVSATKVLVQSFMRSMPPPASQLNTAALRRNESGAPVQYPGSVTTLVLHKSTTPRLTTQVTSVSVTIDAAEVSKPPAMPSAPDNVAESESYASMYTPAVSHYTQQSRLKEDVASILSTPSVVLWDSHPRVTTSATRPSKSILASILERRPVDLPPVVATPVPPRGSGEKHAGAFLTPTELGEDVQPTPADPSDRRRRFAFSNSNSSQASHELDTAGQSLGDSFMPSPPVEQGSCSNETEIFSDRSSHFVTPMDSDSDDSGTDLHGSTPRPFNSPQPTPEQPGLNLQHPSSLQPAPSAQSRSSDPDTDGEKAAGPGSSQTSFLERKALLPEFLIQEAARCLYLPTAGISTATRPVQPEAKESLPQPASAGAVPSLAESVEMSDEEDLDETPLMDSYESTVPESKSRPHCPLHGADLSSGPVVTAPEEEMALPSWAAAAAHFLTAQFSTAQFCTAQVSTAQVSTAQFGTAQFGTAQFGTAHVCTAHVSNSDVGTPDVGATNFGTAKFSTAYFCTTHVRIAQVSTSQFRMPAEAEEATPFAATDGTELVEDPQIRACSQASAVTLRLPAFAASREQQTPEEEDEPVIEQHAIIISAFEAPEREKEEEEEDGVILSDTSS